MRSYRFWTLDEERKMRAMLVRGVTIEEIADELDRSRAATQKRAERLGLRTQVQHKRWTPGQERVVDQSTDQLVNALCSRLGRSPVAIRARIVRSLFSAQRRSKAQLLEVA